MSKSKKTDAGAAWYRKHWKYVTAGALCVMLAGAIGLGATFVNMSKRGQATPIDEFERLDPELAYGDVLVPGSSISYDTVTLDIPVNAELSSLDAERGSGWRLVKDSHCDIELRKVMYSQANDTIQKAIGETENCLVLQYTVTPFGDESTFSPSAFVRAVAFTDEQCDDMWTVVRMDDTWVEIPWNTTCTETFETGKTYEVLSFVPADAYQDAFGINLIDTDGIAARRLEIRNDGVTAFEPTNTEAESVPEASVESESEPEASETDGETVSEESTVDTTEESVEEQP